MVCSPFGVWQPVGYTLTYRPFNSAVARFYRNNVTLTLPLDVDGFLRRECPHCERQFKWRPTPSTPEGAEIIPSHQVAAYYCPYCYKPAPLNAWWTKEQLEHAQQLMASEVLGPRLRRFGRNIEQSTARNRFLKIDVSVPAFPIPEPLAEPNDMVRVDFPCHTEEPVKVVDDWDGELACLVCGIHYPVDLVREMSSSAPESRE